MRLIFLISIVFLGAASAATFLNHQGYALRILTYYFWLLSGGIMLYLLKNEKP